MNNRLILLLITLMVTGLIAPAFAWEMERPSVTLEIVNERTEDANADDEAAAGIGVQIYAYRENTSTLPFNLRDGLELRVVDCYNVVFQIHNFPF